MFAASLLAGLAACPVLAADSNYPGKPIRMIVGFSPGSGSDVAGLLVAQKLSEALGQNVVIDNRPGAGGAIGAELAARAAADGYTLFMLSVAHAIASASDGKLPYDLLRDFAPVSQAVQQPYIVVVSPALPVATVQDFIALAKSKPGQLNYGSTGAGGSNHIGAELFSAAAGIRMAHIPYKGGPPALADVISGQVQFMFSSIISGLPLARGGRLRMLAVTSIARSQAVPDLPTVAETLPGFQFMSWSGVAAPKATPPAIVNRLSAELIKAMQTPELKERLAADGSEPVGSAPQQFAAFIRNEVARMAKVIADAGIRNQ
jgi:tripartite-type tricarboxylate transporter receptor subunit TctC